MSAEEGRPERPGTVVRAVVVRDQHVLLLKRAATDDFGGSWEFPGGGAGGQSHERALSRELVEETGLLSQGAGALLHQEHFPVAGRAGFDEFTYLVSASGLVTISHEHDAYRWHSLRKRLPTRVSPTIAHALASLQAPAMQRAA